MMETLGMFFFHSMYCLKIPVAILFIWLEIGSFCPFVPCIEKNKINLLIFRILIVFGKIFPEGFGAAFRNYQTVFTLSWGIIPSNKSTVCYVFSRICGILFGFFAQDNIPDSRIRYGINKKSFMKYSFPKSVKNIFHHHWDEHQRNLIFGRMEGFKFQYRRTGGCIGFIL